MGPKENVKLHHTSVGPAVKIFFRTLLKQKVNLLSSQDLSLNSPKRDVLSGPSHLRFRTYKGHLSGRYKNNQSLGTQQTLMEGTINFPSSDGVGKGSNLGAYWNANNCSTITKEGESINTEVLWSLSELRQ